MRTFLIAVALLALTGIAFADSQQPAVADALTGNYATMSGSIDQWGVWTQVNGEWKLQRPAGTALQNNIDVQANVEIWERDTLDASNIAFHFGRTGDNALAAMPISAVLTGKVQSNNNCTIDIVAPEGCNSLYDLVWDSGAFGDTGANIPVKWYYSLNENSGFVECGRDTDRKAVAFPNGFGTMAVDKTFYIKLTATPAALQPDGVYKLDPIVSVTPTL